MLNPRQLSALQDRARADNRACVVGAIVVNQLGQAFVMRRSPSRRLFPNCWDIPGGHVEAGETLVDALTREITEETGWQLRRIVHLLDVVDWESEENGQASLRREFDFAVDVDGDLSTPRLEAGKFSEFRWVGLDQLNLLDEHRPASDTMIHHLVREGLERYLAATSTPT